MRAEHYSAHGGGDDYKESHEDDPNDPHLVRYHGTRLSTSSCSFVGSFL